MAAIHDSRSGAGREAAGLSANGRCERKPDDPVARVRTGPFGTHALRRAAGRRTSHQRARDTRSESDSISRHPRNPMIFGSVDSSLTLCKTSRLMSDATRPTAPTLPPKEALILSSSSRNPNPAWTAARQRSVEGPAETRHGLTSRSGGWRKKASSRRVSRTHRRRPAAFPRRIYEPIGPSAGACSAPANMASRVT